MSSLSGAEPKMRSMVSRSVTGLKERLSSRLGKGIIYLFLITMALVELMPIMWLFSTSLRLPSESYDLPPDFLPTSFRYQNYLALFESTRIDYPLFFLNTLKIAVVVTIGQLVTCSMAAFAYARLRFRGNRAIFFLFLASMMIPGTALVLPYFIMVKLLGLIDTHWSMILPGLTSAFGVFLLRQHFMSLPSDLMDAAKIDGASFFRIYWNIMLPMVGPGMASLGIFTFLASWNEYFAASLFLRSWEKYTLPLALTLLSGYMGTGSIAEILASVFLSIMPVLIVFLLAQNFVIESMARSGMKG
jgi:multiple sugar transport system permease protein